MRMYLMAVVLIFMLGTSTAGTSTAETQKAEQPAKVEKTFNFEQGQAIDILFLEAKPETDEKLKEYFAAVFPIVKDAGYRPLPGLRIYQSPTQGNYHPGTLVMASWRDAASRAEAMERIEEAVPDFHQRRRDIWSSFAMTVYEMEEPVSFAVDSEGTYVLTAYWQKDDVERGFEAFKKDWSSRMHRAGGQLVLELEGGSSPFGYRYDPDHLTITRWQSAESFETFYRQNLAMDHQPVEHVNQFILELPAANR